MWRQSRRVALILVTFEGRIQTRSFRLPSVFHKLLWSKSLRSTTTTTTTPTTTRTQDTNDDNEVRRSRETKEATHKHNDSTESLLENNTDDDKSNVLSKKGLLLRKGLLDDSYLEKHGVHIEEIAGGVQVINLPCKTKEKTEFDEYMTSTNEYRMRTVSPHSTNSAKVDALGAGFGMLEDKRLSYLRPRDGMTSEMSLQQKEKEKQQLQQAVHDEWSLEEQTESQGEKSSRKMEKKEVLPSSLTSIQLSDTFAGKMSLFSSFDEHGKPITLTDSSGKPLEGRALRKERFRQQQQLVRSMSGTTFNKHEHPLLIDLDFAKDAHLYGNTREEFERNVRKMKQLISTFQRWESTDNLYRYATIALQLITIFVFTEIVYNYSVLQLLANRYDDFVDVIEGELRELEHVREKDLRQVINELKSNPPDFRPVIDAMKREKYRCEREKEQLAKTKSEEQEKKKKETAKPHRIASDNNTTSNNNVSQSSNKSPASIWQWLSQPSQPVMTISDLLDDTRPHPMDTSHDELHKSKEEQARTSYELKRLRQSMIDEHDKENSFADRVKHTAEEWERFTTHVIRTYCNRLVRTENNVIHLSMRSELNNKNNSVNNNKSFTCTNSDKKEREMKKGKDDDDLNVQNPNLWSQNVLSADDKEKYSYVATPTGIDTMRAVRRILLPRSEDYTQIVREEMVAYQQEKTRRVGKLHESLQIDN